MKFNKMLLAGTVACSATFMSDSEKVQAIENLSKSGVQSVLADNGANSKKIRSFNELPNLDKVQARNINQNLLRGLYMRHREKIEALPMATIEILDKLDDSKFLQVKLQNKKGEAFHNGNACKTKDGILSAAHVFVGQEGDFEKDLFPLEDFFFKQGDGTGSELSITKRSQQEIEKESVDVYGFLPMNKKVEKIKLSGEIFLIENFTGIALNLSNPFLIDGDFFIMKVPFDFHAAGLSGSCALVGNEVVGVFSLDMNLGDVNKKWKLFAFSSVENLRKYFVKK